MADESAASKAALDFADIRRGRREKWVGFFGKASNEEVEHQLKCLGCPFPVSLLFKWMVNQVGLILKLTKTRGKRNETRSTFFQKCLDCVLKQQMCENRCVFKAAIQLDIFYL